VLTILFGVAFAAVGSYSASRRFWQEEKLSYLF